MESPDTYPHRSPWFYTPLGMSLLLAYVSLFLLYAWKFGIALGVGFFGGVIAAPLYFLYWGLWAGDWLIRSATAHAGTNFSGILWVSGVGVRIVVYILISAAIVFGGWLALVVK